MFFYLCIWQTLLSQMTYIAFSIYILLVPGNSTHDLISQWAEILAIYSPEKSRRVIHALL